jgi:hypothetical protein
MFEFNSELSDIEPEAFLNCKSLQSISIPDLCETIDGSAFAGSGISHFDIDPENP